MRHVVSGCRQHKGGRTTSHHAPRTARTTAAVLAAVLAARAATAAHAGSLYFDVNGTAAGSGISSATTYTWSVTSPLWTSDPSGTGDVQAWDPTATAVFSAGADAAGPVTIVVRGTQPVAGIAVEEGAVTLNSSGPASISLTGGVVDVPAGHSLAVKPAVSGTTFTKTGAGTISLVSPSSSFTGGFAVMGGTLQFPGENATSDSAPSSTGASPTTAVPDYVRLNGGALQDTNVASKAVLLNPNKGISLGAAGGTIDIADASQTNAHSYAGAITGPGPLTKAGPGVLLLSSQASTYAGATTVSQGTLRLGAGNALPVTTPLSVNTGATLDMATFNQTVGALSGAGTVANAGRLTVAPPSDTTWSGTISGTGGLTCAGPAFVVLAAAQTYLGPTLISGSAAAAPFGLRLAAAGAIPAAADLQFYAADAASSPTLDLNGFDQTVALVTDLHPGVGHPTVTSTSPALATLTLTTAAAPVDVTIAGQISLVKTGTRQLVLAAPNSYAGPTRVTAGILAFSDPAQLGNGGASNGIVLDGGTLRTDAPVSTPRALSVGPAGGTVDTNGSDSTLSGAVGGAGVLTKSGAGALTLGPTTLPGLVVGAGQVRLAPSGAGTSRLGTLTVAAGSRFDTTDNRLVLTGVSSGSLAALLAAGRFGSTPGDWQGAYGIASSAAAGDLTRSTAIGYATAAQFGVTAWGAITGLSPTDVITKYTYYGDLNLDGQVNADDYALIDRALARGVPAGSAVWSDGDVNYDRALTSADYLLIDRAFALHGGALSPSLLADRESRFGNDYVTYLITSVPEPALPTVFALTLAFVRRRRR